LPPPFPPGARPAPGKKAGEVGDNGDSALERLALAGIRSCRLALGGQWLQGQLQPLTYWGAGKLIDASEDLIYPLLGFEA
jgi:hypothetical protein